MWNFLTEDSWGHCFDIATATEFYSSSLQRCFPISCYCYYMKRLLCYKCDSDWIWYCMNALNQRIGVGFVEKWSHSYLWFSFTWCYLWLIVLVLVLFRAEWYFTLLSITALQVTTRMFVLDWDFTSGSICTLDYSFDTCGAYTIDFGLAEPTASIGSLTCLDP